jgi:transcription antitermination factor NusG
MSVTVVPGSDLAGLTPISAAFLQKNWYAVQTGANQEKQVASRLHDKGIESFLPLYQQVRRRTDRTVVLELPLFPGYLFVRIALRDRLQVLEVPRLVRLVGFGPTPLAVPERDIDTLRAGLRHGEAMPHPYLHVGRMVRVVAGPFQGVQGILVRRKASLRVIVSIEAIQRSFTIEVDESAVEPVGSALVSR